MRPLENTYNVKMAYSKRLNLVGLFSVHFYVYISKTRFFNDSSCLIHVGIRKIVTGFTLLIKWGHKI